jgi:DNA-binding LytR/AlgR family response regulator
VSHPTAIIAEDEPLLAAALLTELQRAWPELEIPAVVGDGNSAVLQALAHLPDVMFLDIRMPGMTGVEAAIELADQWAVPKPYPLLVFVTAYERYAVQAFDAQALDYLVKPVQPARLARTVTRLRQHLANRQAASVPERVLEQLRSLLAPPASEAARRLNVIQASVGNLIHMVPIEDVLLFQAADKYVRVLTSRQEFLIRTPLKDLSPLLDPEEFWQIHRGTVVRASAIDRVVREEAGRSTLVMRGLDGRWPISRLYAHRFRAM